MEVPREALALVGAASKDPARYQLAGIYFESPNGCSKAVATNGKILTVLEWPRDEDEPEEPFILPTDSADTIRKNLQKDEERFSFRPGDPPLAQRIADLRIADVVCETIQAMYPDYRSVLREKGYEERELLVDPFLLLDALKVLIGALGLKRWKPGSDRAPSIKLTVGKGKHFSARPIKLSGERDSRKFLGLVMPLVKQ